MSAKDLLFWCLIGSLLGSSAYFGVNAEAQRRAVRHAVAKLEAGELVSVTSIIDGDTVLVQREDESVVAVRLLGIKAFDPTRDREASARFGKAAMDALSELTDGRKFTVQLNDPPKDRYGRTLARLRFDNQSLGLGLVSRGFALVYTAYPFVGMDAYLREQERARGARQGLWADPKVAEQADLLDRQWRRQSR